MSARSWPVVRTALVLVVVAGLAVDAYVHLHLASNYAIVKTSTVSQADLFRVEAALAIVAGVLLLVHTRRWTAALAFLVAAGGTFAVVLYRYVDVGKIGSLPDMYEPGWYTEKTVSAVAEGIAAAAALVLLVLLHLRQRRSAHVDAPGEALART
jgi:hypothetical protein